jgi:hypothetical protein
MSDSVIASLAYAALALFSIAFWWISVQMAFDALPMVEGDQMRAIHEALREDLAEDGSN